MNDQIIQRRNAMYPRRHPRGPAKTSARAIKRRQRESEVLQYRLIGHSFAAIGKQMNISADTAWRYATAAIARLVPVESAKQVLAGELLKLDAMQTGVYESALHGDTASIDAMLSIIRLRCRLHGLFPDSKGGGINVNIGANPSAPNAEDTGIQVTFVQATKWADAKLIEDKPGPVLDLPVVNGNGKG